MAACGRGQGGGGGAKVRASGYGVFAEVPRGEAFGHRRRCPKLTAGGGAKVRTPWKGVPTTADDYSGSAILTVVPSPILLEIVIFPPSSAVRRSMPESL